MGDGAGRGDGSVSATRIVSETVITRESGSQAMIQVSSPATGKTLAAGAWSLPENIRS